MLCLAPEAEAPNLIASDSNSCYFSKQPENESEIEQALRAMASSCCSGLIYSGSDIKIIKKALLNSEIDKTCILHR